LVNSIKLFISSLKSEETDPMAIESIRVGEGGSGEERLAEFFGPGLFPHVARIPKRAQNILRPRRFAMDRF
jgi:hypothetical protein